MFNIFNSGVNSLISNQNDICCNTLYGTNGVITKRLLYTQQSSTIEKYRYWTREQPFTQEYNPPGSLNHAGMQFATGFPSKCQTCLNNFTDNISVSNSQYFFFLQGYYLPRKDFTGANRYSSIIDALKNAITDDSVVGVSYAKGHLTSNGIDVFILRGGGEEGGPGLDCGVFVKAKYLNLLFYPDYLNVNSISPLTGYILNYNGGWTNPPSYSNPGISDSLWNAYPEPQQSIDCTLCDCPTSPTPPLDTRNQYSVHWYPCDTSTFAKSFYNYKQFNNLSTGRKLVFSDPNWVLVLDDNDGKNIYYSTDNARTWIESQGTIFSYNTWDIARNDNNGTLVAVGYNDNITFPPTVDNSGTCILRSIDNGISWNEVSGNTFDTRGYGIYYGNNVWIAVGQDTSNNTITRSTDDGQSWQYVSGTTFDGAGLSVQYNNNSWIAVGYSTNTILRSTDNTGGTWTTVAFSTGSEFTNEGVHIGYGNGIWLVSGQDSGNNILKRSIDNGLNWDSITDGSFNTTGRNIVYANNRWLFGQNGGTIKPTIFYSDDDGASWTASNTTGDSYFERDGNNFEHITDDIWIAVGEDFNGLPFNYDTIKYSEDNGETWNNVEVATGSTPLIPTYALDVVYANGIIVATGSLGVIAVSNARNYYLDLCKPPNLGGWDSTYNTTSAPWGFPIGIVDPSSQYWYSYDWVNSQSSNDWLYTLSVDDRPFGTINPSQLPDIIPIVDNSCLKNPVIGLNDILLSKKAYMFTNNNSSNVISGPIINFSKEGISSSIQFGSASGSALTKKKQLSNIGKGLLPNGAPGIRFGVQKFFGVQLYSNSNIYENTTPIQNSSGSTIFSKSRPFIPICVRK
jgi:hypothetical protein